MTKYLPYNDVNFDTADELWEALSPTRRLVKGPHQFIYRGQGDASWSLVPRILRMDSRNPVNILFGTSPKADEQVFVEIKLLETFANYCDSVGIRLPNDSSEFRKNHLNTQTANNKFLISPTTWPNPNLLELMALAQHHRVPTRLLDWTKIPYVAAYFAASSAMELPISWDAGKQLAIWALNIERLSLYSSVKKVCPPGAITSHLSAQSGLFTVHPHNGTRGQIFQVTGLEEEFSIIPDSPLLKLTAPIHESLRLLELCDRCGFSAATMYPSADGAGLAVVDTINAMARQKNGNNPI